MKTAHPRFLLLDDNPADREHTVRVLAEEFPDCVVKQVTGRSEFEMALARGGYDLVITDHRLRWSHGLDVLRSVKDRAPGCPVLMLAGRGDSAAAAEALKAGASDCIVKTDGYLSRLRASAWRAIEQAHQRQALAEAERALRESERRYRHITEAVTDYIFTVRIDDGRPVETIHGHSSEVVTGYTSAEFAAEPYLWIDMVPEADRDAVREQAARLLAGGGASSLEHQIVCKDGAVRWVRNTLVPQHDAQDNLVAYDGLIRDITERKHAEEALRESEERFRNLTEHIPGISIQGYRTDGTVVYWNKASEEVYGYTAAEALGKNLGDLIVPPELLPLFEQALELGQQTVESGQFMPPGELLLLHKDGRRVPVYSIHTAVCAADKAPLLFCIDVDLSERKKSGAALEKERDFVAAVLDTVGALVVVLDTDGRIVRFNRACEQTTGYPSEEVEGTPFWDLLLVPEEIEPVKAVFDELRAGRFPSQHENHWLTRDGARRLIAWSNTALLDNEGAVEYVVATGIDATEQRQLEAEFRQSQKMEAVGQLAGGIAHDFNNLLTAISGYTELALARLVASDPLHGDLTEVKKAGERAAALTRQLLAFSRRQVLRPTVLGLDEVVADMDKILRRVIGEDIRLITIPCPGLGRVEADQGQIESVIMNLAVNARDAMPKGGTLTIDTANVEIDDAQARQHLDVRPGPHVLLSVADTGVGMDEETLSHAFEPFFTTKEPGRGTGLGLSTVHGIVKQSGGHVAAYSEPGRGTTVKVFLPRVADTAAATPRAEPAGDAGRGAETILLAEDEDVVRGLAHTVLSRQGYTVLEARDGIEALQVCEQHAGTIHLVVTDVIMPRLSGKQLAKRLRSLRPEIGVLYVSGYADNVIAHQGILDPGTAFLQKPFSPDELTRKVRQVLDAQGTA